MAEAFGIRVSRRHLIARGAVGLAMAFGAPRPLLEAAEARTDVRSLAFFNTHTRESVRARFWAKGEYLPKGLDAINRVLRDHRTGDVAAMDRRLLGLLHDLAAALETQNPFHVISGYRSPATNEHLRSRSEGVARGSLHVRGMAADVRLPGVPLERLRDAALELRRGGVGFYPGSNFVHVDVGRVRRW